MQRIIEKREYLLVASMHVASHDKPSEVLGAAMLRTSTKELVMTF